MKKILLTLFVLSISLVLHSQNENPFKEFGYDVLVATSSKGEFQEFHDQTDIVEIGSVLFNTQTNEIVKVLDKDETTIDISSATAAMSIDPLCEKYYWISPYAYCANNPIRFIDPDGRKIVQYNYTHTNRSGQLVGTRGLSTKTQAAMSDYVTTTEGRAFLAQYASAGDVVGGYKFEKSGSLADQTFEIRDISFEKETGPVPQSGLQGSISEPKVDADGNVTTTLKIYPLGYSKEDVGETITHELQVHGYKKPDQAAGKKVTTASQDHKALKGKDPKHQGYKKYQSVRKELEAKDSKYKKAFSDAEKEYQEKY